MRYINYARYLIANPKKYLNSKNMKQEKEQQQEQQSALDYFWKQISNKYLDSYQKELFTKFYEKAKLIEIEQQKNTIKN